MAKDRSHPQPETPGKKSRVPEHTTASEPREGAKEAIEHMLTKIDDMGFEVLPKSSIILGAKRFLGKVSKEGPNQPLTSEQVKSILIFDRSQSVGKPNWEVGTTRQGEDRGAELEKLTAPHPDPDQEERIILGRLEALLKVHPERLSRFLEEVMRIAEQYRAPSSEPTLNVRQAAERAGVSHGRVHQLYKEGRLGIEVEGNPRFSELECDRYRESVRKPGRPRKSDEAS